MKIRFVLLALSFLGLCSCASISTLQTAETTPEGEFDHMLAGGTGTADASSVSGVDVDANETSVSFPMFEYMGRYGISESFDIGLRTTGFVHGLDVKWNFFGTKKFLISASAGASYLSYTLGSGTTETKVTAIDLVPMLLLDYNVAEKFKIYLAPKYIIRQVTVTDAEDESVNFLGGSAGFRFGKTMGFFAEYTMLTGTYAPSGTNIDEDVNISQVAAGFFF